MKATPPQRARITLLSRALLLALALWISGAAAAPIDAARQRLEAAEVALSRVRAQGADLLTRHEQLASQIKIEKSKRAGLNPHARAQLDALLKASQRSAEALRRQDQAVMEAQAKAAEAKAQLLTRVEAEIVAQRAAFAGARGAARRPHFARLKALLDEREGLLDQAPEVAALEAPDADELNSDDPEELRALADEARDQREAVEGQLQAIEARLTRLRERQQIQRAALAFRRDDVLYAEDERNRQLFQRSRPEVAVASRGPRPAKPASSGEAVEDEANVETPVVAAPPSDDGEPSDQRGGDEAFEGGANGEQDSDSWAEPGGGLALDDAPPPAPSAIPVGGVEPSPTASSPGAHTRWGEQIEGGGGAHLEGAGDLQAQIQALRARRRALRVSSAALTERQARLQARARRIEAE
ncbi:hypothetical protein KKF91_10695 [Myxococcota bacterium]|nr:hypothetical protein [Myxococcota bacterium]MBU1430999.1 hypothetical protein [Myxococcota bacterium]